MSYSVNSRQSGQSSNSRHCIQLLHHKNENDKQHSPLTRPVHLLLAKVRVRLQNMWSSGLSDDTYSVSVDTEYVLSIHPSLHGLSDRRCPMSPCLDRALWSAARVIGKIPTYDYVTRHRSRLVQNIGGIQSTGGKGVTTGESLGVSQLWVDTRPWCTKSSSRSPDISL